METHGLTQSDYATIGQRAWNIVDRIMPPIRTPHGYYDTQGFIAACRYGAERNRRYRVIFWRLVEKVEPQLTEVHGDPLLGRRAA